MLGVITHTIDGIGAFDKLIGILIGIPVRAISLGGFAQLRIAINRRQSSGLWGLGDRARKWIDLCHPS